MKENKENINYNSDRIIDDCMSNTRYFFVECARYFFRFIMWIILFCLWVAFFLFQIALWFITYIGSIYVLMLCLKLSQKIHDSDPQEWIIKYKIYDGSRVHINIKQSYDIIIMMTIYSCAFIFLSIIINLTLHICNKLKMKYMRRIFMYINYCLYILRFIFIMVVYTWIFPYYADKSSGDRAPISNERFYKELQNYNFNAPTDDMKYFWNLIAIGWVLYNIFTVIFGLPLKYSFSFTMAKFCFIYNREAVREGERGGERYQVCCFCNLFCNGDIDNDYIIEDEDLQNEQKYFGKNMTIYKVKYYGLLWMLDKIPPIVLPMCLQKKLSYTLIILSRIIMFFVQLFVFIGTIIGSFILPIYINKIQAILRLDENKNLYTIGIKNIKNIYHENEKSKITHTYNVNYNYNILNNMTIASLIIIYIFMIIHILNVLFLNLKNSYCIVLMRVLTRNVCRFIYISHIIMTCIYMISLMHFDNINMNGRNGFYLNDEDKIDDKIQEMDDDNFKEIKLYWIFCSCFCVMNIFISIFGFPIKYTVTFLTIIYNYNYVEPFEQSDKYTKEFLEKFIFSIYENKNFGVFGVISGICCRNNNNSINGPHNIGVNKERKRETEIEIKTETKKETEREIEMKNKNHVIVEIKEHDFIQNYEQCIICNDKKATCKSNHFNPCKHKVYCMNCHDNFRKRVFNKENYDRCPICRGSPVEL
jgi:hypothetical protein